MNDFCVYVDCQFRRATGRANELAEFWEERIEYAQERMLAV